MKLVPRAAKYLQTSLLGISATLLVFILVESNRDYSLYNAELTPAAIADASADVTTGPARALPPIEEFASIIERPLFMMDRRPYVPAEAVETEQPSALPDQYSNEQYMLSAVIISDEKRLALLQKQSDNKIYKLGVGENIDGWTIKDIQSKTVSLSRGTESRDLELAVKTSPSAGTLPTRRPRAPRSRNMGGTPTEQVQPQPVATDERVTEPAPPVRAVRRLPEAGQENIRQPTPEEIEALQRRNQSQPSPPPPAEQ